MSEKDESATEAPKTISLSDDDDDEKSAHTPYISIDVRGRDVETWNRRSPRFLERISNSVKKILGSDIPSKATANEDILEAADLLSESVKEKLKGPQLNNVEKQASINVMLAEAKEREALARKTNLEADRLEMEIDRDKVLESQRMIDLLIQRGDLLVIEENGEAIFIYNK